MKQRICIDTSVVGESFDAVKMMREVRSVISTETKNMSFEQLKEYIKNKLAQKKVKLIGEG